MRDDYGLPADCEPKDYDARHDYEESCKLATRVLRDQLLAERRRMTRQAFLWRLEKLAVELVKTATSKNADYAGDGDPFANFRAAPMLGVSVERGILVRMGDKMQRIANLLDRPAVVVDESVKDTLSDLATYALILRIWLEQEQV